MHISAVSQLASFAGRHTCVDGANWHELRQHALLSGSHTEPDVNLHVAELQHVELRPGPGSQSSPSSTMPFPHIWSEIVGRDASGSTRQFVVTFPAELVPESGEPE